MATSWIVPSPPMATIGLWPRPGGIGGQPGAVAGRPGPQHFGAARLAAARDRGRAAPRYARDWRPG